MLAIGFIFLIILMVAMFIAGFIVDKKTKYWIVGAVLKTLPMLALAFYSFVFGALAIVFSSLQYKTMIGIFSFISLVSLVAFFVCLFWRIKKFKVGKIITWCFLGVFGLSLIVSGSGIGYHIYLENIPEIVESPNELLYRYNPTNPDGKWLDYSEESDLRIIENVPKMDGATALYPIYASFGKTVYPENELESKVICTTTNKAFLNLLSGESDIIFIAEPSEEQKRMAEEDGIELEYYPVGKEAFVFYVNARNKVDGLTVEQIQKIYSGEYRNWNDLGYRGIGEINAYQRKKDSGSQSALERLMGDIPIMSAPKEDVVELMGGIIENVANYKNHKGAIGYSFRFYSTEMVKNKKIKLLSINGIEPIEENIANGTYPISSNFYAIIRSDATPETRQLVEWLSSDLAQKIVKEVGYTPLNN